MMFTKHLCQLPITPVCLKEQERSCIFPEVLSLPGSVVVDSWSCEWVVLQCFKWLQHVLCSAFLFVLSKDRNPHCHHEHHDEFCSLHECTSPVATATDADHSMVLSIIAQQKFCHHISSVAGALFLLIWCCHTCNCSWQSNLDTMTLACARSGNVMM